MKNLLFIHPADEVPVMNVTIRKIPRYDSVDFNEVQRKIGVDFIADF